MTFLPTPSKTLLNNLQSITQRYLAQVALSGEQLALLRWQIAQGHALDRRETLPGHMTTSALILSLDHSRILLIDHVQIGRWLQPGGHYEPSDLFHQSAAREAVEETGVLGLTLHPWHRCGDIPFVIDSHDVLGNSRRGEVPHVHHDLQYLFRADPQTPLRADLGEVHSAAWKPVSVLEQVSPKAAHRLMGIG